MPQQEHNATARWTIPFSLRVCVLIIGGIGLCGIVLYADQTTSSKVMPRLSKDLDVNIYRLVDAGYYEEAIDQWERAPSEFRDNWQTPLAWYLAKAYMKQGAYEKAIAIYKSRYHFITESVEQRAEVGEVLLFGKTGVRPTKDDTPVGKGQCVLCHQIFKERVTKDLNSDPFQPHLFNFVHRIEDLIASPTYQHRSQNTVQPEAFPGSGRATTVIEYLAESNVCPSCYIAPRIGRNDNDRESIMPKIHKPAISLTIDEMIAIDTWLLKREGYQVPPVSAMRAAYEKFLQPEERPINEAGIRLASLYDAAGHLAEAIRLLEANYNNDPKWKDGYLSKEFRNDPEAFKNLKRRPEFVRKFANLLQADSQ